MDYAALDAEGQGAIAVSADRAQAIRHVAAHCAALFGDDHVLKGPREAHSIGDDAVGAVFSALEVVPLALLGFEAYENYRHSRLNGRVAA